MVAKELNFSNAKTAATRFGQIRKKWADMSGNSSTPTTPKKGPGKKNGTTPKKITKNSAPNGSAKKSAKAEELLQEQLMKEQGEEEAELEDIPAYEQSHEEHDLAYHETMDHIVVDEEV